MELQIAVVLSGETLYTQYIQVHNKKQAEKIVDKIEAFFEELEF